MEKVKNTCVSGASALYNPSCLNRPGVKSESLGEHRGSAVSLLLVLSVLCATRTSLQMSNVKLV